MDSKHSVIDNYFLSLSSRPDSDFFRRVIENENKLQINPNNLIVNQELCNQYKKLIEAYAGISNEKIDFYTLKLNQIIIDKQGNEAKEKKESVWSQYIKKKKQHVSHLMCFLQLETSKTNVQGTMEVFEQSINDATNTLNELFDKSTEVIQLAKARRKRRRTSTVCSVRPSVVKKNDMIGEHIDSFLKKFHFAYLHSNIFKTPIELLKEIMDDIYVHKITKYFDYQEQIKQFQMLLDAEEENQHKEGILYHLQDLQHERTQYLQGLNDNLRQIERDMNTKCIETNIESDILIQKYKGELLKNISQLFN